MEIFLQLLLAGIVLGSVYALVALGFTLIFGVMKILNFAHGDILMVGAYIGYVALISFKLPLLVTALVVVVAIAVLAVLIERFVLRFVENRGTMAPLIATFGIGMVLENLVVKFFGPDQLAFPAPVPPTFYTVSGVQFSNYQLIVLAAAALLMIALKLLLDRTRLGQSMLATAEDAEVASFLGINTRLVVIVTLAIASMLAGVAGLAMGLFYNAISPFMGINYGIKGLVILVLGGGTSMAGSLVGGLLMGVAETMTVGYLSSSYRDGIAFALLVLVLLIKPAGLFGKIQEDKV
jgi:branched-chain amino acid transport system permease protein